MEEEMLRNELFIQWSSANLLSGYAQTAEFLMEISPDIVSVFDSFPVDFHFTFILTQFEH